MGKDKLSKLHGDLWSNFKLNLKFVFSTKFIVFAVFVFMIFSLIIPTILFPYKTMGGFMLLVYDTMPLLIILGGTTYSIRKSTLYQNMQVNNHNKFIWYLSQILTIFLLGNILTFVYWPIIYVIGYLGGLMETGFGISFDSGGITRTYYEFGSQIFKNGSWFNILYISNVNILVVFAFYFVVSSFVSNIKSYNVAIGVVLVMGIVFTGSINTMFDKSIKNGIVTISSGVFPEYMFYPSLLYPFYGTGQFVTTAVTRLGMNQRDWNVIYNNPHGYFVLNWFEDAWQWSVLLLQPYITILIYFVLGVSIRKIKKYE